MRLIDADELMEHVWRDKLDSRELIAAMIENAPTVRKIKPNGWVSVKDRLPERHETVLMYLQSDTNYIQAYYEIGFYQPQKAKWYAEDLNYIEDCYTVTHWMPLPNPPEKPYEAWDRIAKEREDAVH